MGVVGYVPPKEVIKGHFYDRVHDYAYLWFVDHSAYLDRSILKLPIEEIIQDNHKLAGTKRL